LYADHQNRIEFLPLGLDVLPRLGAACEQLAHRLQAEIDELSSRISVPLPKQIPQSYADTLVRRLAIEVRPTDLPQDAEIEAAATWSSQYERKLQEIETALQRLSEPAKAAAQCRRLRTSLESFLQRIVPLVKMFSSEAAVSYREQFAKTQTAREAASIAAKRRFDQDPLGSAVGSAAWQKLYEYAERFNASVYPGEPFPATGRGRVCLLCQQALDDRATDRMKRFKAFIDDTSQHEARNQELILNNLLQKLANAIIPSEQELNVQFLELTAAEPSFASVRAALVGFISAAARHKDATLAALNGKSSLEGVGVLDQRAVDTAQQFATGLEEKAVILDKAVVDTDMTAKLQSEHRELLEDVVSLTVRLQRYYRVETISWWFKISDGARTSATRTKFQEKTATFETNT
jgi:hypothetical protein